MHGSYLDSGTDGVGKSSVWSEPTIPAIAPNCVSFLKVAYMSYSPNS